MASKHYVVLRDGVTANVEGRVVALAAGALLQEGPVSKKTIEHLLSVELIGPAAAQADSGEDDPSEMAAGDDPADFSVKDVQAYLATADEDERARVLEAERAGKARSTILGS